MSKPRQMTGSARLGACCIALMSVAALDCSSGAPSTKTKGAPSAGPASGGSPSMQPPLVIDDVSAKGGGASGSGPVNQRKQIDRTRGQLPDDVVDKLLKGGTPGGLAFLYPYDQTVFPGGLLPPTLQWSPAPGAIDSIYVHVHSQSFDYQEVFPGSPTATLELPQDAWDAASAQSQGASDPAVVELTTLSGSTVNGPISQRWIFARGQLKSAVYYNTYDSAEITPNNGAVMRILPLEPRPEVIKTVKGGLVPLGPCYSCHSLSANGQTLVAQRHQYPGGPYKSESFDVAANPDIDPPALAASSAGNEDWGFSAVSPDGAKVLTAGQPSLAGQLFASFPFAPTNNPGMLGPRESLMFDARSGAAIPTTGLIKYAMMPSFAPDGKRVVFNDYDHGQGHSIAVMDFDNGSNTFSNLHEIYRDASLYPGWPFFTPDGKKVIFALGDGSDFATVQDPPTGLKLNSSDLYSVDAAGGATAVPLLLANGAAQSSRDQHLNYYPTVSPVAAGGYFWVFFTSRRSFGNLMTSPATDPKTKKIWVAAVDIDGNPADPSHPAFYLPGQELASGNMRAFATLSPCHSDGSTCTTGIDCCSGFCVQGQCSPPSGCSGLEDKCGSSGDCCDNLRCIGGFCGLKPVK